MRPTKPPRASIPLLVILAVVSTAASVDPGSHDSPELGDAEGDVAYPDACAGPRGPGYLDIIAAWIEFQPSTDAFDAVIQVT